MKLYTEEQLHELIYKYRKNLAEFSLSKPSVQNLIDELTPVTLPTDEEMLNNSPFNNSTDYTKEQYCNFMNGATYVINKIKGIQNEK